VSIYSVFSFIIIIIFFFFLRLSKMKSPITSTSYFVLAVVTVTARLAHAQSYCDASVGYVISDDTSSSSTDTGSYVPDSDCDAECQLYYSQQQSLYSDYFNDAVTAGGNSFLSAAGGKRDLDHNNAPRSSSLLSPRQSQTDLYLTCTAAETCFVYENIPLCIDMETGDFTDPTGGSGNVITGTYNAAVDNTGSSGTGSDDDSDSDSDDITSSSSSSSGGGSTSSPNGALSTRAPGGFTFRAILLSAALALLAI
jgi:hypothetical protein